MIRTPRNRWSPRNPSPVWILPVLLAGCLSGSRQNPFSDAEPPSTAVEVTIRNESSRARDVYAIWEGANRDWLGIVPAETTLSFTIAYRSDAIRFSGGPRVFTAVYPGDRLEVVYPRAGQVFPPRRLRPR